MGSTDNNDNRLFYNWLLSAKSWRILLALMEKSKIKNCSNGDWTHDLLIITLHSTDWAHSLFGCLCESKCVVVHEINLRNLLPNTYLPSTVSTELEWWSRGLGFNARWGYFFILFFSVNAGRIWQKITNCTISNHYCLLGSPFQQVCSAARNVCLAALD